MLKSLVQCNSHACVHVYREYGGKEADEAEAVSDGSELRPTTPLETSQSEPSLSKSSGGSGHTPSSPTGLGGTYRVGDGGVILGARTRMEGVEDVQQVKELELLNESALESRKQLVTAEEK